MLFNSEGQYSILGTPNLDKALGLLNTPMNYKLI